MRKMHQPTKGLTSAYQLRWGVLQAVSNHEIEAMYSCSALGIFSYFPQFIVYVPCGGPPGTKRKVLRGFFQGYVFFGVPPGSDRWKELFRAEGVVRPLLVDAENMKTIPVDFLLALAGHEDEEIAKFKRVGAWPFKIGDRIRILDGEFTGLYGELTELDDDGRIVFLLDFMGRKVPIRGMTADQVERSDSGIRV